MIPSTDRGVEVQSNLSGEKIDLSFDENSLAHLMSVLTDLYSDPELAVIREYSTNALDAHREAGNSDPIEVELPGPFSPYLKVRDRGVGLDAQAIADTYSKYGASTKRETNAQVGMLGLGCKSALTYAQQFTVTGVKDGTKTVVSVSRDEDGGGSMTVVDQSETDEPNGVEVVIPARNAGSLERKARQFFRYWEAGTVLVNGEEPAPLAGIDLSDDMLVVQSGPSYGHDHRVVMGNVPYPANLDVQLPGGYSLVVRVPVGAVDFPPNREALMYTARTKARIEQIEADFQAKCGDAVQRKIDAAATRTEAIEVMVQWRQVLPTGGRDFTYGGEAIPDQHRAPADSKLIITDDRSSALSSHSNVPAINVERWPSVLFVQGYDRQKFTAAHKKKLKAYVRENEIEGVRSYVLSQHSLNGEAKWIDPERLVVWEDVNAIKLPRAASALGDRIPGSYDLIVSGSDRYDGLPADEIETDWPVYYTTERNTAFNVGRVLESVVGDHTLVILTQPRVAKFCRHFPAAKDALVSVRDLYEQWKSKLTKDQQTILNINDTWGLRDDLIRPDEKRVKDPALRRAVRLAKRKDDLTALLSMRKLFQSVIYLGREENPEWDNPLEKYPLVADAGYNAWREHEDHIYLYINAVHQAG